MVDATASHLDRPGESEVSVRTAGTADAFVVSLTTDFDAYEAACAGSVYAPAQDPDWVRTWLRHLKSDAVVATVSRRGTPILALAVEIEWRGPFKLARLVGGGHANGNFAPAKTNCTEQERHEAATALFEHIARQRPDIDVLTLERLTPSWHGIANPLLALPHARSPNVALAADLSGGFDALLGPANAIRKRKRHRYQARNLALAGPLLRLEARSADDASAMIDAFFDMKKERLRKLGVANVFSDPRVQAFFRDLFVTEAAKPNPKFMLDGLRVGDSLRAVTGSSISGSRVICDFAAISDDEEAWLSPGDYLFFENIAQACRDGATIYDFGVGDEPYKRNWCNIETEHFDVWAPLTAKGSLLATALRAKSSLKTLVKRSPLAWRLLKAARGITVRKASAG